MVDNKALNAQKRTALAEKLWLSYFNQILYERDMITEQQRNKIHSLIENRKTSPQKTKIPKDRL